MKFYIPLLTFFLLTACAAKPPINNAANEQIREKNKQTAALNEVTKITRLAQTIEQQGRDLQLYREVNNAESARQCNLIVEEKRQQLADIEIRINNLPENYRTKLLSIVAELNECLSCVKNTVNDCKKARASINQAIKEIYP